MDTEKKQQQTLQNNKFNIYRSKVRKKKNKYTSCNVKTRPPMKQRA